MNESEQKRKSRIELIGAIIAIVLSFAMLLTVLLLPKKGTSEKSSGVSEKPKPTVKISEEAEEPEPTETTGGESEKPTIHSVGCGITGDYADGYAKEHFYVTDPTIYSRRDPVDYYEVDASGTLTKLVSKEVNYSINTWTFDSEGRPSHLWHNAAREAERYYVDYQYDDMGRVIRMTREDWYGAETITDIVYGETKKTTIRYYDENGKIYQEDEYEWDQRISRVNYDEEGNVIKE